MVLSFKDVALGNGIFKQRKNEMKKKICGIRQVNQLVKGKINVGPGGGKEGKEKRKAYQWTTTTKTNKQKNIILIGVKVALQQASPEPLHYGELSFG